MYEQISDRTQWLNIDNSSNLTASDNDNNNNNDNNRNMPKGVIVSLPSYPMLPILEYGCGEKKD